MLVTIRKLTEDDWLEYSEIRLKALRTDPKAFTSNYEKELQSIETDWRNRVKNNTVFLIYEDSTAIGMTGVSIDCRDASGKTAIFWGSWLAPHARGKNLSKLMYQTRLNWAKRQQTVERIIVSHRASNLASKYAIQKYGFVWSHTEKMVWSDGISEDLISYELKIKL